MSRVTLVGQTNVICHQHPSLPPWAALCGASARVWTCAGAQPAEELAPYPAPGPCWESSMFLERCSERLGARSWTPLAGQRRLQARLECSWQMHPYAPAGLPHGNLHRGCKYCSWCREVRFRARVLLRRRRELWTRHADGPGQ